MTTTAEHPTRPQDPPPPTLDTHPRPTPTPSSPVDTLTGKLGWWALLGLAAWALLGLAAWAILGR